MRVAAAVDGAIALEEDNGERHIGNRCTNPVWSADLSRRKLVAWTMPQSYARSVGYCSAVLAASDGTSMKPTSAVSCLAETRARSFPVLRSELEVALPRPEGQHPDEVAQVRAVDALGFAFGHELLEEGAGISTRTSGKSTSSSLRRPVGLVRSRFGSSRPVSAPPPALVPSPLAESARTRGSLQV